MNNKSEKKVIINYAEENCYIIESQINFIIFLEKLLKFFKIINEEDSNEYIFQQNKYLVLKLLTIKVV